MTHASVETSEKSQLIGSVASELNDLVKNTKRPATLAHSYLKFPTLVPKTHSKERAKFHVFSRNGLHFVVEYIWYLSSISRREMAQF